MKNFHSLKSNADFKNVYENGRKKAYGPVLMYVLENGLDHNRLGVSISRKRGNSVERHTFVRRMREIFRLTKAQIGYDIIISARARVEETDYSVLERAYSELLKKHSINITDISE